MFESFQQVINLSSSSFIIKPFVRICITVLPLVVHTLRNRQGDIPLLVHHFLKVSCRKNERVGVSIPLETLEALVHYDWPGNVRELETVIERAVAIGHRQELTLQDVLGDQQ